METNTKNFGFYKNIGVKNLSDLAHIGGFDSWKDLQVAYPFIKEAKSILELGAAYGRCLDFLKEVDYKGEITAIEQSEEFTQHLKDTYSTRAEIIEGDFKTYDFNTTFGAILWMWSGILDFSVKEQKEAVQKLYDLLDTGGKLVIDTPRIGFKTFAAHNNSQSLHHESPYGDLDCYIPSYEELESLTKNAGFTSIEQIDYETTTNKQRSLFVVKK